jgi:hypothetical protein
MNRLAVFVCRWLGKKKAKWRPGKSRSNFISLFHLQSHVGASKRNERAIRNYRKRWEVTAENDADFSASADLPPESNEVRANESCSALASKREQRKAMNCIPGVRSRHFRPIDPVRQ